MRFAKPRAKSIVAAAVAAAGLVVLVALVVTTRVAAPKHPPAVMHSSDWSRTVYVDFHLRHTRVGWRGEPPVSVFKPFDGHPSIALTFDCAWVNEADGMKILDFLKTRAIHATFFISGPFVCSDYRKGMAGRLNEASFRLIRRMIEDGHEFGSHTWTHPHNVVSIDWERENDELRRRWEAVARELFGDAPASQGADAPLLAGSVRSGNETQRHRVC